MSDKQPKKSKTTKLMQWVIAIVFGVGLVFSAISFLSPTGDETEDAPRATMEDPFRN